MVKLKLLEEIIRKDHTFSEVQISREDIDTADTNSKFVLFDPQRLRLNFGTRTLYVFGRTENGKWVYYLTTYDHTGEPAGPLFWATPGLEGKVITHIKEQLQAYTKGEIFE